jgi:hypothetical protein
MSLTRELPVPDIEAEDGNAEGRDRQKKDEHCRRHAPPPSGQPRTAPQFLLEYVRYRARICARVAAGSRRAILCPI